MKLLFLQILPVFKGPLALFIAITAVSIAISACGPIENFTNNFADMEEIDLTPPSLTGFSVVDSKCIVMSFDEDVKVEAGKLIIEPSLGVTDIHIEDNTIRVSTEKQETGKRYSIVGEVTDLKGNSNSFIKDFYGHNGHLPRLLINEFTTRGSGRHPDFVELFVTEGGNMGGINLLNGTLTNWKNRLIFPAFTVESGDYIIVHFKPTGGEDEIDETIRKDQSGGYDSSPEAFDFWVEGGTGLSGNNGVLSLYESPEGILMDGVIYSNRTSDSDSRYGGFGLATTLVRARELADSGGWYYSGESIAPEDAVNPEGSTGTRSICRNSNSADTDRKADWHIVPTRGATPGSANRDDIYSR